MTTLATAVMLKRPTRGARAIRPTPYTGVNFAILCGRWCPGPPLRIRALREAGVEQGPCLRMAVVSEYA